MRIFWLGTGILLLAACESQFPALPGPSQPVATEVAPSAPATAPPTLPPTSSPSGVSLQIASPLPSVFLFPKAPIGEDAVLFSVTGAPPLANLEVWLVGAVPEGFTSGLHHPEELGGRRITPFRTDSRGIGLARFRLPKVPGEERSLWLVYSEAIVVPHVYIWRSMPSPTLPPELWWGSPEPMGLDTLTVPSKGRLGVPLEIQVTGIVPNGCGNPWEVKVEEDPKDGHLFVNSTYAEIEGMGCPQAVGFPQVSTVFVPSRTGKYELRASVVETQLFMDWKAHERTWTIEVTD